MPSSPPFNRGLDRPSYAEVEIVLGNDGFSAFQPDVYGAEIRVVRRITDGGSSSFALKNYQGETGGGAWDLGPETSDVSGLYGANVGTVWREVPKVGSLFVPVRVEGEGAASCHLRV